MGQSLAALVGSRICHDIISPIGAIANGVELLEMSGVTAGPELDLINQSSKAAANTVRLLRMAFGPASTTENITTRELADVVGLLQNGGRTRVDFRVANDVSRAMAKLMVLSVMCTETSLLPGISINLRTVGNGFDLDATGPGQREGAAVRLAQLTQPDTAPDLAPSFVHFPLAAETATELGLRATVDLGEISLSLQFR